MHKNKVGTNFHFLHFNSWTYEYKNRSRRSVLCAFSVCLDPLPWDSSELDDGSNSITLSISSLVIVIEWSLEVVELLSLFPLFSPSKEWLSIFSTGHCLPNRSECKSCMSNTNRALGHMSLVLNEGSSSAYDPCTYSVYFGASYSCHHFDWAWSDASIWC